MNAKDFQKMSNKVTKVLGNMQSSEAVTFLSVYIANICHVCNHSEESAINFVTKKMSQAYKFAGRFDHTTSHSKH